MLWDNFYFFVFVIFRIFVFCFIDNDSLSFFVFTFIFFQQVSNVFAISEQLSPALATWLPNLVYLVVCVILLRFTPK